MVGVAGEHLLAFQGRGDGTEVDSGAVGSEERLAATSASTLSRPPTLPWSAKARRVASGIVLISGAISSSTYSTSE